MKNVSNDNKLLVISHARILRALLAKGVLENCVPGGGFINPIFFDNSEMLPAILIDDQIDLIN